MKSIIVLFAFLGLTTVQAAPEAIVTCKSKRVDIQELPNDSFVLSVYKMAEENKYQSVITNKQNQVVASFEGLANADLLADKYLAFEQSYGHDASVMTSQNASVDYNDNTASWGQYKGCEVIISVLFDCL